MGEKYFQTEFLFSIDKIKTQWGEGGGEGWGSG